ncbi:cytochrome P450 302a1, mitochondrial [Anabrus simplex]|uniref:cytochrome P450 302a1, mitochondrial n=1 Tax=Anabrus simplex TaxID=316456 RepID=UPI0035A388E5
MFLTVRAGLPIISHSQILLRRCNRFLDVSRHMGDDVTAGDAKSCREVAARPFEEIPGPRSFPVIGTLLNYLPIVGKYSFDRLHRNGHLKLREYGPLVREEIVPGVNLVWVFTPEDIEMVYRSEGRYPERRSHLAIQKYRGDHPEIYNTGGLLPTNGPEWWRLRSLFQKALSRPQNVKLYIKDTDTVMQQFVDVVRKKAQTSPEDFLPLLSHVFLELVGLVAFDAQLDGLSEAGLAPTSRASQLIEAAETTNNCIISLDNGLRLWRWIETPLYNKMKKAHQYMESVAVELVSQKKIAMEKNLNQSDEGQASLLELYLSTPELDIKDVVGMAVDMILAGMDTTSFSSSFALYHLATNPSSQQKLYEESCQLLPNSNTPITAAILSKAQYAKAVLKETFRLNPISVGIGRILPQDTVLSGYHVPKGTVVVTQNQVTCQLEEYFTEAKAFLPERWLKDHALYQQTSPYLVLPFGHGPRTCIARRLAEQNMLILLLKLVRHFEIGWCGGNLDCRYFPNKPDQPVLLSFKER